MNQRRPRCPSFSSDGYRCRRLVHSPDVDHVAYGWQGSSTWTDADAAAPRWETVTYGHDAYGWSVERLREAAATHVPVQMDPTDWVDVETVNKNWWRGVDLGTPVILIPHPDGESRPLLVDGRHRVYKAYRMGRQVLAVTLTREQERQARFTNREWQQFREPDPFET